MKKSLPVTELARDSRFSWTPERERAQDLRAGDVSNGNYQRARLAAGDRGTVRSKSGG